MADDAELLELLDLPAELSRIPAAEAEIELSEEEKKFQEERRTILGGTDQAAHLGFSTFRNAWDVAAEKKGLLPPWMGNERTQWGQILEEPVAREYARRTEQKIRRVNTVVRDREFPFLGGHPDRMIVGKKKGLEIKTVERGQEKWSKPGEPMKVPKDYYLQCQHYMRITGCETWDLAALFGLSTMRWYTLERNEAVIRAMVEKGAEFWEKYVLGPDLPPMEGERAKEYLRGLYAAPKTTTYVLANAEQAEAIAQWRAAKNQVAIWQKDEERFKLHVQQAIGDAEGIVSGDITLTWKKNKDSTALVTDWEALLVAYAQMHGFEVEAADIAKFTRSITTKVGPRVLREAKGGK